MNHIIWEPTICGHKITYELDATVERGTGFDGDVFEIKKCRLKWVDGNLPTGHDNLTYGISFNNLEEEAMDFLADIPTEEWDVPPDLTFEEGDR